MNKTRKALVASAQRLDLPADILAGVPRMEWIGNAEFSVEPHKGLKAYSEEEVVIDSTAGEITVQGKKLSMKQMNHNRISVTGTICTVKLREQNG